MHLYVAWIGGSVFFIEVLLYNTGAKSNRTGSSRLLMSDSLFVKLVLIIEGLKEVHIP